MSPTHNRRTRSFVSTSTNFSSRRRLELKSQSRPEKNWLPVATSGRFNIQTDSENMGELDLSNVHLVGKSNINVLDATRA